MACMQDLVPRPGIEPGAPALGAWCLTHWTTREVPSFFVSTINRNEQLIVQWDGSSVEERKSANKSKYRAAE